jgi:hypothetical protein
LKAQLSTNKNKPRRVISAFPKCEGKVDEAQKREGEHFLLLLRQNISLSKVLSLAFLYLVLTEEIFSLLLLFY